VKSFAYTAVDSAGQPTSGTVEAADWPAAQALLTSRGLRDCRHLSADSAMAGAKPLNAADALELATYLSQLIKAELPLAGSLRAAAADLPKGNLSGAMKDLAARLEIGESLDTALDALGRRLPARLRAMVVAGARGGQLTQTLDAILAHERAMDELGSQLTGAAAYPLVIMIFLAGWLLFAAMWLVPAMQLDSLLDDFGVQNTGHARTMKEFSRVIPPLILGTVVVSLLAVLGALVVGGRSGLSRLVAHLPLIGAAWWYRGLADFCGLLSIFLKQQIPLGESLRLTSTSTRDPAIAAAARQAAARVERGEDLAGCLAAAPLFPPTVVCLVRWGEEHAALPPVLSDSRQMFAERFEQQVQLVRWILPPIVFLLAAISVCLVVGSIYGPLMQLIQDLATFTGPSRSPAWFFSSRIQLSGVASVFVAGLTAIMAAQLLKSIEAEVGASLRVIRYTGLLLVASAAFGVCLLAAGWWGLGLWAAIAVVWLRAALHNRRVQKRNFLAVLTLAAKRQLPLAPLAMAFAQEQEGGFALRSREMARNLERGMPLADAITLSSGVMPPEAPLAAHLAAASGDLPDSLSAATRNRVFDRTLLRPVVLRSLYVFPAMVLFVLYMKIKIEPSLVRIFSDFDIELPWLTRRVIGGNSGGVIIGFVLVLVALTLIALLGWLQWIGWLKPRLPILKRTSNWVEMAVVLRVLALAARLQRPLPGMLHVLSNLHPKVSVRDRLRLVVWQTNNGVPWQDSLRQQKLLSKADAAMLAAAQRNGNLSWALTEMAESFERRASHRLQAIAQIILPLLMLPLGLVIMALAIAYFAPLPLLIESLS
jgi:type II secretory pathway component PulF